MSAGQLLPLQISCWSHSPTAARQTVPFAHWMVLQWSVLSLQSAAVQGSGLSWQVPFPQVSRPSQYRPFEHVAVLFAWVQPVDALQASSVQGLPSVQFRGVAPWQLPPEQSSAPLHAFPSLHELVLLVCAQPDAAMQASFVHEFWSLQSGAMPA